MDKKYDHKLVESKRYDSWVKKGYFSNHDLNLQPYTIILPPPNVTGKLHLGHAWDGYLQDVIVRFYKMNNYDVLWVPGTDHAGIATQAKVEEKLREQNISRYDLGREKFLDEIWKWKDEYSSIIHDQWAKLGFALDYSKEKFTMDENMLKAVHKVFIKLYDDGLIYYGKKAINWDVKQQTALSNIEVLNEERKQKMYYVKYQLLDDSFIEVATTRPETMFSDVAIAINPSNDKLKHLINKYVRHPLTNKVLPIIASEKIEIDKGSGAMKVSAHAILDIEIINDNNLEVIECIDRDGKMNDNALEFKGLDRFDAREKVFEKLESLNLITKVDDVVSNIGISERSGATIEILMQNQWFVRMKSMAKLVLDNLSKDGVKFYPIRFEQVLKDWMTKIEDWCISRQLWWGIQIPAWFNNGKIKVQLESPGENWCREEDVLDTWFSSALAPFAFVGWNYDEDFFNRYFPTDLLVTGYDIIFFWVARMYFQSLYFTNTKPFKHVLIHGLVRDSQNRKMSKSLGNGIDPMEIIDDYGSDALRWFLITNSSPGLDIRFSQEKLEASWNIINKIWNISRFILESKDTSNDFSLVVNSWISYKLSKLELSVKERISTYEFTIIGKEIYKFIIEDFSGWYIELSKECFDKKFALDILKRFLILVHPFLPFVTDYLYEQITNTSILGERINYQNFTTYDKNIDIVIEVVDAMRKFRSEKNISFSTTINYDLSIVLPDNMINTINRLVNANQKINQDAIIALNNFNLYIELSEEFKNQESNRIAKEIEWLESEISRSKNILNNVGFLAKAPETKIDEEKSKLQNYELKLSKLLQEKK